MEAQRHSERHALAYGLCAVLLWSTVATGFKLGLAVLELEQLLLLGTVISWFVFLCYATWTQQWRLCPREILLVCGLGLINPFIYYLVLFAAYDRLPAHIAQPLNYTWAITLAILAVPILGQKLNKRLIMGIVISYLGVVVLLTTASASEHSAIQPSGVVLALFSTLLWALYWLLSTRSRSAPSAIMFWSFSIGLPCIAATCWLGPGWPEITPQTVVFGAWVGLVEMGITFILWQAALNKTQQAAKIGQLIFLSPFLSLVLIYVVLGEHISPWAIVALAIIVTGMRLTRTENAQA